MKFQKDNQISKGKGRPIGSKDVVTSKVREAFENLVSNNLDKIQSDLDAIERPETRLNIIIQLSKFVIPTLKSVDAKVETIEPQNIMFNIQELYKKNEE